MPLRMPTVDQHAVPIAGARIELQIFLAERLCDHIEQHAAVLGFNVTGGMVAHDKVFIAVMPAGSTVTKFTRNAISSACMLTPMAAASSGDRPVR